MNYRSVVVLGEARPVEGPEERLKALEAFTERLVPGRWDEVRPPTPQELKGTRVLAFDLDEASAKVRTGPPVDDDEDYELDVWAGVDPAHAPAGASSTPGPEAHARHRALGGRAKLGPLNAWLLGSGGWIPTATRETTCVLVRDGEHALILDAGTGLRRAPRRTSTA